MASNLKELIASKVECFRPHGIGACFVQCLRLSSLFPGGLLIKTGSAKCSELETGLLYQLSPCPSL